MKWAKTSDGIPPNQWVLCAWTGSVDPPVPPYAVMKITESYVDPMLSGELVYRWWDGSDVLPYEDEPTLWAEIEEPRT